MELIGQGHAEVLPVSNLLLVGVSVFFGVAVKVVAYEGALAGVK